MENVFTQRLKAVGLRKGERSRLAILISTHRSLQKISYEQLRVSDICEDANISHGLFYHYFDNKSICTENVCREFLEHFYATYMSIHRSDDLYDDIFNSNLFYIDTIRINHGLAKTIFANHNDMPNVTALAIDATHKWHMRLANRLAKFDDGRALSDRQRILLAYSLGGMLDDLLRQTVLIPNPFIKNLNPSSTEMAEAVSLIWSRALGLDHKSAHHASKNSRFRLS